MSIQNASKKGDAECVKMWLAVGVSPNSNCFWLANTPLIEAAVNDRIEVVKLLLEKGADPTMDCNGCCVPEKILRSLELHEPK